MKNYISQVSDEEIAAWIVDYLEEVGFCSGEMNMETCDELVIQRDKGNIIVTAYFDHPNRSYYQQEYIRYNSNIPGVDITEKIHMTFYGNSYNMEVLDMYSAQIEQYAFKESESIAEDLKRYWQSKMYNKFVDEHYLENLNKAEDAIRKEMENQADASEIGL